MRKMDAGSAGMGFWRFVDSWGMIGNYPNAGHTDLWDK